MPAPGPIGEIITITEGAVPYTADDLRQLLETTDPASLRTSHDATRMRNIVSLDDTTEEGLRLRWTRSLPPPQGNLTWDAYGPTVATRGEPPIEIDATVAHVEAHERELARLGARGIRIPLHNVYIVDDNPYSRWPIVYSVVEHIPGPPLVPEKRFSNQIRHADPEKLLEYGTIWIDYFSEYRPANDTRFVHEDTAGPHQCSTNLTLYDIEPCLTKEPSLGIEAVRDWAESMRRKSPERAQLIAYANHTLFKTK